MQKVSEMRFVELYVFENTHNSLTVSDISHLYDLFLVLKNLKIRFPGSAAL